MCVATTYARYRARESGVVHRRLTYHHGGIGAPQCEGSDKGTPGESRGRKAEGPRRVHHWMHATKPAGLPKNTRESYMSYTIPVGRHKLRFACLAGFGAVALTISACQDVAAPNQRADHTVTTLRSIRAWLDAETFSACGA